MRKTLMAGVIASVFALGGTASAAPLILDLNGAAPGGTISATALDWTQTSFLAQGGNAAIANFLAGGPAANSTFDVYTHAKLIGYTPAGANQSTGLPNSSNEITLVAKFTERVVAASPVVDGGGNVIGGSATFTTTGAGWLELYYSNANSNNLTGSGFDDGTLIMRASGVRGNILNSTGSFTVDFDSTTLTPFFMSLDSFGANNYNNGLPGGDQLSVIGSGSQGVIKYGNAGVAVDSTYVKSAVSDFSILFNNISIGLPYDTVDPSDCFNTTASATSNANITAGLGGGQVSECTNAHVTGNYASQGASGGYVPVVGGINGLFGAAPDFVAQTDFNSAVTGTAPEPGSIALMGLALGALGLASRRRRV